MELQLINEERYYLKKLSKFLNYQLSTSLLYIASFFGEIFIAVAIIATIIFTSLMLYVFFKLKKKAWILTFLIFVIIPTIASIIIGYMLGLLMGFIFIPLAFFYFYCFMLKNVINDRLEELFAKERLELEREEEKENNKLWQSQYDDKNKPE